LLNAAAGRRRQDHRLTVVTHSLPFHEMVGCLSDWIIIFREPLNRVVIGVPEGPYGFPYQQLQFGVLAVDWQL
jgi:hypothetical protein